MAESLEPTVLLEESKDSDKITDTDCSGKMECPVCLQTCIHPARLPCGHIFCFLCVKGVAHKYKRCAMCRRDIPASYLEHPQLVHGTKDLEKTIVEGGDGYQWFYEGRNGWWQYDERTSQELEDSYNKKENVCTILVAGYLYNVDFEKMHQSRADEPSRMRRVKRDLASIPKKGVAGIRFENNNADAEPNYGIISAISNTDDAIRIAENIVDSTLLNESANTSNMTSNRMGIFEQATSRLQISSPTNRNSVNHNISNDDFLAETLSGFSALVVNDSSEGIIDDDSDAENSSDDGENENIHNNQNIIL